MLLSGSPTIGVRPLTPIPLRPPGFRRFLDPGPRQPGSSARSRRPRLSLAELRFHYLAWFKNLPKQQVLLSNDSSEYREYQYHGLTDDHPTRKKKEMPSCHGMAQRVQVWDARCLFLSGCNGRTMKDPMEGPINAVSNVSSFPVSLYVHTLFGCTHVMIVIDGFFHRSPLYNTPVEVYRARTKIHRSMKQTSFFPSPDESVCRPVF